MKRIAVIVIGSNSTRMLSADAQTLLQPVRRRIETRLFLHMEKGAFSAQAVNELCEGIAALQRAAQEEGAQVAALCATSAVRDAANAPLLASELEKKCGLLLRIIDGQEEAALSFYGVSGEESCGMIDIGGGSTEIAIGQGMRIACAVSLQLGASRLFRIQPINETAQLAPALAAARKIAQQTPARLRESAQGLRFYLVGGTGTAAAHMLYPERSVEGCTLCRQEIDSLLERIASTPRSLRTALTGFPASRLDIFPTGLATLLAVMDTLNIGEVTVSQKGNADGLLRDIVHKKFA